MAAISGKISQSVLVAQCCKQNIQVSPQCQRDRFSPVTHKLLSFQGVKLSWDGTSTMQSHRFSNLNRGIVYCNVAPSATAIPSLERVDFLKLQNGSDIRGVAVSGVEGEPVNLTEPVTEAIAAAFSAWLLNKKKSNESRRLRVSIGHDSRVSTQKLQDAASRGIAGAGLDVVQYGSNLYTVLVHYSGSFVHTPTKTYTSTTSKMFKNVDLQNMSVNDMKNYLGDIIGEWDSLFYKNMQNGAMRLLSPESKSVMLELADAENRCIQLFVYHLPLNQFNWDDGENYNENENEGNNADNSAFVEGNNEDRDLNSGSENVLRDEDRDWSDEEFMEIRKNSRGEILRMNTYEKEANYENEGSGEDSDSLHSSGGYAFSSEESDEEVCYATPPPDVGKVKHVNEVFNGNTAGKDIKLKAGLLFSNKKALKDSLRSSSMGSGRPYKYLHNDKKRIQVVCASGCPFKMWASYNKDIDRWQIKTIVSEHNCVWDYKNKHVSVNFLVEQYGDRIRRNPNWKLVEMQDEFKRELKVDVCEAKCSRVRQKALSGVEDKMKEHYEKVRRFAGEILHSNRNNTVKIRTTRLQDGDIPRFQRMYVCYDALKKAWKSECRPVLGLDGCFLKTVCGGQLLSAVGRDGSNCIFPVAMAVVERENYDSWKWFLELLTEDLELGDGFRKTLISDQQKGLDKAIRELLPQVEHRFCTRHLSANLSKVYPSSLVSNAFWKASTATHPQAFKKAFKELERASKGAWEKMNGLPPGAWSKAYFGTHSNTDSTENNISECFNSWILKARYMPLIDMLLEIHDMIMTRIHQNRDIMARKNCVIVPRIKKILDEAIKESVGYKVLWDGRDTYVVKGHGGSVSVNLKDRTCACRVWDLTGVPCCHAVTAIQESRQNPLDFVAKWYTKETYMRTYSNCLEVIRGEEFWEDVEGDTVHPPLIVKKLRGRPKTQRRREGWEGTVSKGNKTRMTYTGRKMHCGICRKEGHNKNACPDKPADGQPQQPKQKRQRKNKKQGSDDAEKEVTDEFQRQGMEKSTGEDDLMNEAMREVEEQTQGLDEVDHSIQIEQQIQTEPNKRMRFMATPSLRQHRGTGCTPPASTPPASNTRSRKMTPRKKGSTQSKPVKAFAPPRQKK